jgi:hypothetical protein
MRPPCALLAVLLTLAVPLEANDALSEARRLYNLGQYESAERAAVEAMRTAPDAARVVIGRVRLERYRQSAEAADLAEARIAFRVVDPRGLTATERVELAIGLAETLYFEDRFGAAAELFDGTIDASFALGPAAHERVLDWWATALDRLAQALPPAERREIYGRILDRMVAEVGRDPGSTPAGYWLVAAARGAGDLDRAWSAATASWVRASLARDRGAALRADLNRLVVQAIIPERANRMIAPDRAQAVTGMLGEWEAFKTSWER